jgi:hypothetical protein
MDPNSKSDCKDLKCDKCSLTFFHKKSFLSHKNDSRNTELLHACKNCNFTSCTIKGIENHESKNHLVSANVSEPAMAAQIPNYQPLETKNVHEELGKSQKL